VEDFFFRFADQFLDAPPRQFRGRRIDEGRPPLEVEAVNAFTGRVENVLVAALEFL